MLVYKVDNVWYRMEGCCTVPHYCAMDLFRVEGTCDGPSQWDFIIESGEELVDNMNDGTNALLLDGETLLDMSRDALVHDKDMTLIRVEDGYTSVHIAFNESAVVMSAAEVLERMPSIPTESDAAALLRCCNNGTFYVKKEPNPGGFWARNEYIEMASFAVLSWPLNLATEIHVPYVDGSKIDEHAYVPRITFRMHDSKEALPWWVGERPTLPMRLKHICDHWPGKKMLCIADAWDGFSGNAYSHFETIRGLLKLQAEGTDRVEVFGETIYFNVVLPELQNANQNEQPTSFAVLSRNGPVTWDEV